MASAESTGHTVIALRFHCLKYTNDKSVRELLVRAYGASVHHATAASDTGRAAEIADAIVPLLADMQSQPEVEQAIRKVIAGALDLAIKQDNQDNQDAERRLRAASRSLL